MSRIFSWGARFLYIGLLAAAPARAAAAEPASKGKVLVVLSSEDKITLKGGIAHPTGFYLQELMVPIQKLLEAGYEPVFANPKGSPPVMDAISDLPEHRGLRELCRKLGVCGEGLAGSGAAGSLTDAASRLSEFKALLVPGGHAPMEDLWKDPELGRILRHFHAAAKPTALICHGPIALLSALKKPEEYIVALEAEDVEAMKEASSGWIYEGYAMASFTAAEERQVEGQSNVLGGFVRFYPDEALEKAGGLPERGAAWESNIRMDRELLTAQNPNSDKAFAEAFVGMLKELEGKP